MKKPRILIKPVDVKGQVASGEILQSCLLQDDAVLALAKGTVTPTGAPAEWRGLPGINSFPCRKRLSFLESRLMLRGFLPDCVIQAGLDYSNPRASGCFCSECRWVLPWQEVLAAGGAEARLMNLPEIIGLRCEWVRLFASGAPSAVPPWGRGGGG